MRKNFTAEPMRQIEGGMPVTEVCRKVRITKQTLQWKRWGSSDRGTGPVAAASISGLGSSEDRPRNRSSLMVLVKSPEVPFESMNTHSSHADLRATLDTSWIGFVSLSGIASTCRRDRRPSNLRFGIVARLGPSYFAGREFRSRGHRMLRAS